MTTTEEVKCLKRKLDVVITTKAFPESKLSATNKMAFDLEHDYKKLKEHINQE